MPVRLSTTHVAAARTSPDALPLRSLVPRAWVPALRSQLDGPGFAALSQFVDQEYATGSVFPPRAQIFTAL